MLHQNAFHAMGCDMLAIVATGEERPPAELEHVPGWFEQWEQTLSRFRLDSELSQLNRMADQPVRVSPALWEVYQAALQAEDFTQGLVSPGVGSAVILAGYDRSFELLRESHHGCVPQIQTLLEPASTVLTDAEARTICLPPGMQLDLGGVAKGWAAHQAVQRLQSLGPALMNAGGDIAISGSLPGGEPWKIGVANPFEPGEDFLVLHLGRCGVATSGRDRRRWFQNGQARHHIIDPRSGLPAQTNVLTATAIAPTAMEAEAAAKSAFIMGSEAGISWLESDPTLAGLLILEDGEVLASSRIQEYL
jgi:thiamine biosynthesis lipoprotein